jgi:hypothetical protein
VVPGLAILAMQAAQILPRRARLIVVVAAIAQSVLLAAARENDIRMAAA